MVKTSLLGSVFLYGRGARERSEFYWLKASYFTLKFHPHYLITLVTCHDRSPFKKLVARTRIELVIIAYQATVMPFNYPAINMRMITADDAMLYLYQITQGVYTTSPHATTTRLFKPDPVLVPQVREFKPDPLLIPPSRLKI